MEAEQVKKKRIRKKTCEIDSIEKLKSNSKEPIKESKEKESKEKEPKEKEKESKESKGKNKDQYNKDQDKDDLNQSQISFGKFNITVKKQLTMTPEELRNYYDKKFKIEDSEKTAKLMVQDSINSSVIFEPLMENEINTDQQSTKVTKTRVERTNIHKILIKFTNGIKNTWPENTDILCWWCAHPFDTVPLPCPIEYDDIRERYKVNGIFCSWPCVAAYSIREYSSLSYVYQMRNELSPTDENIVIAPPKQCLKSFGGYMTIKDFRALDKSKTLLISTETLSYVNQEIAELRN